MSWLNVEVWIEGQTPLLMSRFGEEAELATDETVTGGITSAEKIGAKQTRRQIAEKAAYRDARGYLCFPTSAILRLMREAAAAHKIKGNRKSLKHRIPSLVRFPEAFFPIYDPKRSACVKDYEIDSRSVVNQKTKGRIMAHRPRIDHWTGKILLAYKGGVISEEILRQVLAEGGEQMGIGAFRPEKGGCFGTFDVVAWNCIDGRVAA